MAKIFGIDLGTTYSCIAYVNDYGKPEVVNNQESSPVTPSVVAFEEGGNYSVGDSAKNTLSTEPEHVCSVVKRQMGRRDYSFDAFDKSYTPEAVSSFILKKLANDASEIIGEEVKNVVITCPAYFGLDERKATEQAGVIAGLNVLGVLNEPTAAAISYGLQVNTPQTIMVYDLGGGTFDVTILKVANGVIEVVATGGDHQLGGKDWDNTIREYVISEYCKETGQSSDELYDDLEIMGDLELRCETAKKTLTTKEKAVIKLNGKKIEISRDAFEQQTKILLDGTINMTRLTLGKAEKKGCTVIDKILMVGGSTRMPQVEARLHEEFPNLPIEFCDPDQSVAKGAAIYGMNIAAFPQAEETGEETSPLTKKEQAELQKNPIFTLGGNGDQKGPIKIVNVISQSIAVRLICADNVSRIVNQIYKNTAIPLRYELHAGTNVANQTSVLVEIFENASDEEYVEESNCKPLVEGELGPLPQGLPAYEPIDIVFNIDQNGLLSIDVEHKPSNAKRHMDIKLGNMLSQEEIEEEFKKINALKMQ